LYRYNKLQLFIKLFTIIYKKTSLQLFIKKQRYNYL